MRVIRPSSFAEAKEHWEAADTGRSGGNTLGLLVPFENPRTIQSWSLVEVETGDEDRLHALYSNKKNGETGQWEVLSGGTYRFPDIARTCLDNPSVNVEATTKILDFGSQEVTWDRLSICITRSLSDPNVTVFCFDGCNRLAAHHVRLLRSEEVETPSVIVGVGEHIEAILSRPVPYGYGFELP